MISAINSVSSNPAFGNYVVGVMRPNNQAAKVAEEVASKCTEAAKDGVKFIEGKAVKYLGKSPFKVPENVAEHFVKDKNASYFKFSYPVENITKADRDFLHSLGTIFVTKA